MTIKHNRVRKVDYDPNKIEQFSCKATRGCDGNQAKVESAFDIVGHFGYAGRQVRYRCLSCNRTFTLRR